MSDRYVRALLGACLLVVLFASTSFADIYEPIAVPEPASMTLLAIGGAGMYLLNRRRS